MLGIVALRAYYDGSGKVDDPGCRFLNLGALAGSESGWDGFRTKWIEVLSRHEAPLSESKNPYFHSKEAMHNRGGYSSWDTKRAMALVNDLFKVIGDQDRADLIAISCSINLEDYRAVKAAIPALRSAENVCVDWCFGYTLRHPARDSGIELYFDRKENYYSILKKLWKHQGKPGPIWWALRVVGIEEVNDMRDWPEIQAADLVAWLANRCHTLGNHDKWGWQLFRTFLLKSHYHGFFDQSALLSVFNSGGTMKDNAELPAFKVKPPTGTALQVRVAETP